jgi:glucose uptake protein
MILPGSPLVTLLLVILTLLCGGLWANSLKLAGSKWRFELFYYDFTIGAVIAAALVALTFGSMGLDGFTVLDDLHLAGKRQDAFALAAGGIFNLGNILIVAALSLTGLSVAFPIGLGIALIVSALLGHFLHPGGSALLLYAGCASLLAAVVFDVMSWKKFRAMKAAEAQAAAAAAALTADAAVPAKKGKKSSRRRQTTRKGFFLAVFGGIAMGLYAPLVGMAQEGENGVGPYTAGFLFTLGIAFSTFVYNLFFMNLPVQGNAVELREFFQGKPKQHLSGIAGGMIWFVGLISALVAARAEPANAVSPALSAGMAYGAPLIAALCGVLLWKEYDGADNNVRLFLGAMFFLLLVGVAVVAIAPVFGVH